MSSSTSTESSWTSQLKVKQLKQVLRLKAVTDECVERSELDVLVRTHVESLEAAHELLKQAEQPSSSSNNDMTTTQHKDIMNQLQQVLRQDRGVLNYTHYTPSSTHLARMKKFATIAPGIFDNPHVTPRNSWFTHVNYHRSTQMPPYHVHFREELQEALRYLYEAYAATSLSTQQRATRRAQHCVQACLSGLGGHVGIEEQYAFPSMQRRQPRIDLTFLFEDHQRLDRAEKQLLQDLRLVVQKMTGRDLVPRDSILTLLRSLLDFDVLLMTHLGEEEEVVVPITLVGGGMM